MEKSAKLKSLKNRLVRETENLDIAKSATQVVFGDGDENADVIIVGEAPGRNEDEQGKPFVGASGKVLDEMLGSAGLDRSKMYVTNIVKFRPPNNRDPFPEEKQVFWPYLVEQIEIIKPKLIVTLGVHSGRAFLPEMKISEDHGKVQKVVLKLENKETNVDVLPLYHPAAMIYNRKLREVMKIDILAIKNLLN